MREVGKIKPKNMVCVSCGTKYLGGNRSLYCTDSCKRKSYFDRHMLNYKTRLRKLMHMAKNRAESKNLDFNIDTNHLVGLWDKNYGCCALTGTRFILDKYGEKGQVHHNAPSIDRIIPNRGYTKGNVRLITYHLNISLSDFGADIFEDLAKSFLYSR